MAHVRAAAQACLAVVAGHGGRVRALTALPNGCFATGSIDDSRVRVWRLFASSQEASALEAWCAEAWCADYTALRFALE